MKRLRIPMLAIALLFSGCAKKPVTLKNGVAYLQVGGESLDDRRRRPGYNGKTMEIVTLVSAEGIAYERANWIFQLADGAIIADAVKPWSGFRKTRLYGTYYLPDGDKPVFTVDDAVYLDVPELRTVTLAEIDANPVAFDGAHVAIEGDYTQGHNYSMLAHKIAVQPWLSSGANKQDPAGSGHLRIEGWLSTRGGHYGGKGAGRYFLLAEKSAPVP